MPRDTKRRLPDPEGFPEADDLSKNPEDKFGQFANRCPDKPGRPCSKGDHKLQYQEFLSLLASHDILVPSRLQAVLAGKMAYDRAVRDKLNSTSGLLDISRQFGFLEPSTATKQSNNGSGSVTTGKPKYRATPDVDGQEMSRIRKQRAERSIRAEQ